MKNMIFLKKQTVNVFIYNFLNEKHSITSMLLILCGVSLEGNISLYIFPLSILLPNRDEQQFKF